MDTAAIEMLLAAHTGPLFPAAQLTIRHAGAVVLSVASGDDAAAQPRPVGQETLFDLASLTKLFVATAFMRLVEAGSVALDAPVRSVLPAFDGPRPILPSEDPLRPGAVVAVAPGGVADAGQVTFRHLLAHTSGLPPWRPLFQQPDLAAARRMATETFFAAPVGSRPLYSDIGLILLGMAVAQLSGLPLDEAVRTLVTEPLGLRHTRYLPPQAAPPEGVAPTELCAWRGRRVCGEVHDENAAALGGVAGHAGLFSTASEVAALGQLFLDGGQPLLQPATVAEMTRLQAADGAIRRGLGWALWSDSPEVSGRPLGPGAFGHTGFTGTSLWVDPKRALVVACLTNDVYHGRTGRGILAFRTALHQAAADALPLR